jgi:hypothetical protein
VTDHTRFRQFAATALDFELEPDERAELDAHLADCGSCHAYADSLRGDLALVRALPAPDAPIRVRRAVLGDVPGPARSWTRLATAVAVLALVLLPIGAGAILLRDLQIGLGIGAGAPTEPLPGGWILVAGVPGPTGAPTQPPPAASLPTTPPASGVPAPTRPPAGDVQGLAAVAWAPGLGFVAVGDACPPGDAGCAAAVVASFDGRSWRRIRDDALALEPINCCSQAGMRDVTSFDGSFVAVGADGSAEGSDAAFWWSEVGEIWVRQPGDVGSSGWANALTPAGPGRLVAVGGDVVEDRAQAAVWLSADGSEWQRLEHAAELDAGVAGPERDGRRVGGMHDVAWNGASLVAVGAHCDGPDGPCRGIAWTSFDGTSWQRHDDAFGFGIPEAVAVVDGSLVAVGRDADLAAAWSSADGRSWQRTSVEPEQPAEFNAVADTEDGGVAVGVSNGEPRVGIIWTAPEGKSWFESNKGGVFDAGSVEGVVAAEADEAPNGRASVIVAVGRGQPGEIGPIWLFDSAFVESEP